MTWFASSTNETESAKEHVAMFLAVAIDLPSGIKRFWTGIGDLSFGGNTYTGTGEIGEISMAPDHLQLVAERKTYRLTGIPLSLVIDSDIDGSFGRDITEYFGFLDVNGVLVATPEINWEGRNDSFRRVDGSAPVIEISAEHRLSLLDKTDNWRYTHEHQQVFYAGDMGFNMTANVTTMNIFWGNYYAKPGGGGNNRGGSFAP
jgi:hypothetical protein